MTGRVEPVDIMAAVLGLVTAWAKASPASRSLAAQPTSSPERLRAFRAAMTAAVRFLIAP